MKQRFFQLHKRLSKALKPFVEHGFLKITITEEHNFDPWETYYGINICDTHLKNVFVKFKVTNVAEVYMELGEDWVLMETDQQILSNLFMYAVGRIPEPII